MMMRTEAGLASGGPSVCSGSVGSQREGPVGRVGALLVRGPGAVPRSGDRWVVNGLSLAGAALLVITAVIPLHLWSTGYRPIRTLGPLVIIQSGGNIVVALAGVVFRPVG